MSRLLQQVANIPTGWREVISKDEIMMGCINLHYEKEQACYGSMMPTYPPLENVFRCFSYFDPEDTKVVILGQDPYHGPSQAMGLCFGVDGETKAPPSLRNIEKELKSDIGRELEGYTMEKWAKQGVLMLNSALTVRHRSPASHMKWWKGFTEYIIEYLNKNCEGIVFLAWGAFAHKKMGDIDTTKHKLIVSSHPSPLSYLRPYGEFQAFKGSKPFSKMNEYLSQEIDF